MMQFFSMLAIVCALVVETGALSSTSLSPINTVSRVKAPAVEAQEIVKDADESLLLPSTQTLPSKSIGVAPPRAMTVRLGAHPVTTWKRRLDTKQDPFNVHKWAGLGWLLSSTAIFGTGTLSAFTEVPAVLEPFTYLFLASTVIQSVSTVPMALKYRRNDLLAQRGFISSAITTSNAAFVGFWLSPFAEGAIIPEVATALVGLIVLADSVYSIACLDDMKSLLKAAMEQLDLKTKAENFAVLLTSNVGLPLNAVLLQQMLGHDDVREYFLSTIASNGSTLALVYYASMTTSIAISMGNLAATLSHRKLITKDVENLAIVGSLVVTLVFNLKAAGMS